MSDLLHSIYCLFSRYNLQNKIDLYAYDIQWLCASYKKRFKINGKTGVRKSRFLSKTVLSAIFGIPSNRWSILLTKKVFLLQFFPLLFSPFDCISVIIIFIVVSFLALPELRSLIIRSTPIKFFFLPHTPTSQFKLDVYAVDLSERNPSYYLLFGIVGLCHSMFRLLDRNGFHFPQVNSQSCSYTLPVNHKSN